MVSTNDSKEIHLHPVVVNFQKFHSRYHQTVITLLTSSKAVVKIPSQEHTQV